MKILLKYLLLLLVITNVNTSYSQIGENQKEFDKLQIVINDKFKNLEFDTLPALLLEQKITVLKNTLNYSKYLQNTILYWKKNSLLKPKDTVFKYNKLICDTYEYLHLDVEYGNSLINTISSLHLFEPNSNSDSLFNKVDSIIQITNNMHLKYDFYIQKANIFSYKDEYTIALEFLTKAERIWNENDFKKGSPPYNSLCYLYYVTQDYKKSIHYIDKAISYNKKNKNWQRLSQMLNNKAETLKMINPDSILIITTLKSSIKYAKTSGFKYGVANASEQLARLYIKRNELDSAKHYIDEIDIAVPIIEEPDFLAEVSMSKAKFYLKTKQRGKALKLAKQAYNIWVDSKMINTQKKAVELIIEINVSKGDYKEALRYEKINYSLRDSLVSRSKIIAFKEMEFSNQLYNDSIVLSVKNSRVRLKHKNEINNKKQNIFWLITGLIAVIFISVFYFVSNKNKQNLIQQLDEKTAIIEMSLNQKQLLLKEIHHRVKNNFQIVSSLLQLQTKDITDEKALGIVKEGQNRVKSMALIHQKLYQNDDLLINFNVYVNELFRDLNKMYSDTNIECDISINPNYRLDIDTAMPLGLILNELITNAFKYAFEIDGMNKLKIQVIQGQVSNQLIVSDNGKGITDSIDLKQTKSIGLKLVKSLAKQLHGKADFESNDGAKFTISFKETFQRELVH